MDRKVTFFHFTLVVNTTFTPTTNRKNDTVTTVPLTTQSSTTNYSRMPNTKISTSQHRDTSTSLFGSSTVKRTTTQKRATASSSSYELSSKPTTSLTTWSTFCRYYLLHKYRDLPTFPWWNKNDIRCFHQRKIVVSAFWLANIMLNCGASGLCIDPAGVTLYFCKHGGRQVYGF